MTRPDWHSYYLGIADAVSKRGECVRRQVGAVLVRDFTIVATGYNGTYPGGDSCLDGACPRGAEGTATPGTGYKDSGCTVVHAEANCIIRAGRERCVGAVLYCTDKPCDMCSPLIAAAGIERVIYYGGAWDVAKYPGGEQ